MLYQSISNPFSISMPSQGSLGRLFTSDSAPGQMAYKIYLECLHNQNSTEVPKFKKYKNSCMG